MMRRVMDAGALGCEIVISGKLTGPRSRTEKFISGYIKHSGKPAIDLVDKGYSVAVKKLGVIGCQVRIIPPDIRLPDDFQIQKPLAPPAPAPTAAPAPAPAAAAPAAVEKKSDLDQLLESEPNVAEVKPTPLSEAPVARDEGVAEDAPLPEEMADCEPCAKEE
jgi:small subunit ribosomal protein S3